MAIECRVLTFTCPCIRAYMNEWMDGWMGGWMDEHSPRVIVDDDLSLGRERVPICVVNEVDDAPVSRSVGRSVGRSGVDGWCRSIWLWLWLWFWRWLCCC
jgi:hypothetical protein